MKLRFDHTFCYDHKHVFREKLGKSGFFLSDGTVEHPGAAFCRFITFPVKGLAGYQYLEFIHIGPGGEKFNIPGISFGALSPLRPFQRLLQKKNIKSTFEHKNYNWKENNTDNLPGWNFVVFKRRSNIFSWLTEYEDAPRRKSLLKKPVRHPNKAKAIVGLDCTLSKKDIEFYSQILGKPKEQIFILACGVRIDFKVGRSSRLHRVYLSTKDLKSFVHKYPFDELGIWNSSPVAIIKNPNPKMWDVALIQES